MKVQNCLLRWGALLLLPLVSASAQTGPSSRTVAIFAANRAEADLNGLVPVFEDFLAAGVTDLGYRVISQETSLGALSDLRQSGNTNALDALLEEQSSALSLSRNLGARYILFATIDGLGRETRNVQAYDVNFQNNDYTLQATYRILDGNTGAAVAAGVVTPQRTIQQSKHSQTTTDGLTRQLLLEASRRITGELAARGGAASLPETVVEDETASFSIRVVLDQVSFPEVSMDQEGRLVVTANRVNVQPTAVSVELDGILIGTTPASDRAATLEASPGLHRLRLSRADLEPVERMVNIREGLALNFSMRLSEQGRQQWLENTALLQDLKAGMLLTEAQAEALRGLAQMLRQSGFRVETDEGLVIERNQNLMNQD